MPNNAKGQISKRVFQENKARQISARTCAYQGVKNVRFCGKFGVLCFLETSVLRFALLPYYRRSAKGAITDNCPLFWRILLAIFTPIYNLVKFSVLIFSPLTERVYRTRVVYIFNRSNHSWVFHNIAVLRILNSQENACDRMISSVKLQASQDIY